MKKVKFLCPLAGSTITKSIEKVISRVYYIGSIIGCTLEQKRMIRNEVEKCMNFERIIEQTSSAAVSCNCGPGTLGLIYLKKDMMPDMF